MLKNLIFNKYDKVDRLFRLFMHIARTHTLERHTYKLCFINTRKLVLALKYEYTVLLYNAERDVCG